MKYTIQDDVDNTAVDGCDPEKGYKIEDGTEWSDADMKMEDEQYDYPATMVIGGAK